MRTLKLTVEYDGGGFSGWQVQPRVRTVQEVVERGLAALLGEEVRVTAAGRTDAGVHAAGQVISLRTGRDLPLRAFVLGLNAHLPEDVSIAAAEEAPDGFDARRSASGKRYRYRIWNGPTRSALRRRTHWAVFRPLDVEAMQAATAPLLGRHDFSAFRAADCPATHAVRELTRVEVRGARGGELEFVVEGTAFLKHMVRNLVGTLCEVGQGKRDPGSIAALLAGRDRTRAGATAPPEGLTLEAVFYDDPSRLVARGPPAAGEEGDE